MKKHPIVLTVILCLLCVALTLGGCTAFIYYRFGGTSGLRMALQIVQARAVIEGLYVGDVNDKMLTDGALRGMTASINDRWSYYMSAEEYAAFMDYSNNQYTGIGITVSAEPDGSGIRVQSVTPDSPAERAGICAGMLILAVDGYSMEGATTTEARSAILANENGEPCLVVRDDAGQIKEFTVQLEKIQSTAVYDTMLDGNVGYIYIENFESGAGDDTIEAVERLHREGACGLIFDVRGNPGGRLTELTQILDYLLPEGEIFVSCSKNGEERVTVSDNACVEMPMAVLVNDHSYSAAEYFAAVLSEYGWAETFGTATTGKARSQVSIVLSNGGALHISTASYLTPKRVDLSAQGGFTPDHVIEPSDDRDAQLDAVLEFLQSGK